MTQALSTKKLIKKLAGITTIKIAKPDKGSKADTKVKEKKILWTLLQDS